MFSSKHIRNMISSAGLRVVHSNGLPGPNYVLQRHVWSGATYTSCLGGGYTGHVCVKPNSIPQLKWFQPKRSIYFYILHFVIGMIERK